MRDGRVAADLVDVVGDVDPVDAAEDEAEWADVWAVESLAVLGCCMGMGCCVASAVLGCYMGNLGCCVEGIVTIPPGSEITSSSRWR